MRKIRLSEIFTSFQGEGRYTGMPSIWVRFFGCNLQCDGFGQKDPLKPETYILPYKSIDVSQYKSMSELPVFQYGCDSSYSWESRFKKLAKDYTVDEIVNEIDRLGADELGLKNRCWYHPKTNMLTQLCFTGGEPMLNQKAMHNICEKLTETCFQIPQITIETNGTIELDQRYLLREYTHNLHLSCSPKLESVSGESNVFDVSNTSVIQEYVSYAHSGAIKIVHNGSSEAWEELDKHTDDLQKLIAGKEWQVWIMPVGSVLETQQPEFLGKIASEAMLRGFWVSHRTHISVFGNKIGT